MGDTEILEIYLNSASKNTSETDIIPRGPKSVLTSVIFQRTELSTRSIAHLCWCNLRAF